MEEQRSAWKRRRSRGGGACDCLRFSPHYATPQPVSQPATPAVSWGSDVTCIGLFSHYTSFTSVIFMCRPEESTVRRVEKSRSKGRLILVFCFFVNPIYQGETKHLTPSESERQRESYGVACLASLDNTEERLYGEWSESSWKCVTVMHGLPSAFFANAVLLYYCSEHLFIRYCLNSWAGNSLYKSLYYGQKLYSFTSSINK